MTTSDVEENISSTSASGESHTTKGKKKKRRRKRFDLEDCSEVTPIISNRRSKKKEGDSSRKKEDRDGIDYGQLVVESRSSNDACQRRRDSVTYMLPENISSSADDRNEIHEDASLINTSAASANNDTSNRVTDDEETGGNTNDANVYVRDLSNSHLQSANAIVLDHIWLPFFVCLFSTTRFILSTTASLSCRFIKIDIGFVPKNVNFMSTDVFASPFAFHDGTGCLGYPKDFTSEYIDGNNSWRIARFAAIVNMILGSIVFFIASAVVIYRIMRMYPVSAGATSRIGKIDQRWESWVFIFVILMFVAEVLKFVFWGINLCTEDMWLTQDSSLQTAIGGCTLASGARCSVSALAFDLATIMTLTVGSNNLRTFLSSCCTESLCCISCSKRESEPVNTEGEGEIPNSRNNDGDVSESTERVSNLEKDEKKKEEIKLSASEELDQENSLVSNDSEASQNKDEERSGSLHGSEAYSDSSRSHELEDSSDDSDGMSVMPNKRGGKSKHNRANNTRDDMIDLLDS